MTSSTFSSLAANPLKYQGTYTDGFWRETPSKISGEVVTVFFPINNTSNEGVVVYGDNRPDLAPENHPALKSFDLSTVNTLVQSPLSVPPWYQGGKASIIMMLYSYFDVTFSHNSIEEVVRFCYGTSNPYKRGDVLLKNKTTGIFEWLNISTNAFTSTRPTNPLTLDFIANFQGGPDHPDEKYFPLAGKVSSPTDGVDLPLSLVSNYDLIFTVDFDFENSLLFENVTTQASFDATPMVELIKWVDMSQNRTEWYKMSTTTAATSIITCTVTTAATLKTGP